MKIQIRESARSTAEEPLYVWHLHDGRGRAVRLGFAPSEAQAKVDASAAVTRLRRERQTSWLVDFDPREIEP